MARVVDKTGCPGIYVVGWEMPFDFAAAKALFPEAFNPANGELVLETADKSQAEGMARQVNEKAAELASEAEPKWVVD